MCTVQYSTIQYHKVMSIVHTHTDTDTNRYKKIDQDWPIKRANSIVFYTLPIPIPTSNSSVLNNISNSLSISYDDRYGLASSKMRSSIILLFVVNQQE